MLSSDPGCLSIACYASLLGLIIWGGFGRVHIGNGTVRSAPVISPTALALSGALSLLFGILIPALLIGGCATLARRQK